MRIEDNFKFSGKALTGARGRTWLMLLAMAIGGLLRGRDWIARRTECGSPCQLCRVKCSYGAIEPSGRIQYSECFQCLDCVSIHDDPTRCVPLVLKSRAPQRPSSSSRTQTAAS